MTAPRTMREYHGNQETASAIMALVSPMPREAVMAMGSSSGGKARNTSEMRISAVSRRPPKYPERSPMGTPMAMASPMTTTPTMREVRAPYRTWEKMSWPSSLAPIRWARQGGLSLSAKLMAMGS